MIYLWLGDHSVSVFNGLTVTVLCSTYCTVGRLLMDVEGALFLLPSSREAQPAYE